jgi:hypothetical protein
MNVLKTVERLVVIRDEIRAVKEKLEHHQRELDGVASELIEFLKQQQIIETRTY